MIRTLAILLALVAFAPTTDAAYVDFVRPTADATIPAGRAVLVVARAAFGHPPEDLRLEVSEDAGVTFRTLDADVNGRSVRGTYVPTDAQTWVVLLRTLSVSDTTFNHQIQVYPE